VRVGEVMSIKQDARLIKWSALNAISAAKNMIFITKIRNDERFYSDRIHAEIQRTVHQIEKGLSIEKPKKGFGTEKISLLIDHMSQISDCTDKESIEVLNRGRSCVQTYMSFYDKMGWDSDKTELLRKKFENLKMVNNPCSIDAGLIDIKKVEHTDEEYATLDRIASSRHSIRDFAYGTVSTELVLKAISFAQKAPSACNRQSVRCYIVGKDKYSLIDDWLSGIGYFGDYGFDKLIIITGKITGYSESEGMQHLVSPGIFVGYLQLALEALNIGSCIMQRSLYNDNVWDKTRKMLNIPEDEQSYCLIGCGIKKERYKVPVSKRLSTDIIAKVIE